MTFEALVRKISPTLKRIAYRLNGHHSFFNDEDLYQEALIFLWLAYRRKIIDGKTDSYILQGCYFHLKNFLRKTRAKARCVSLDSLFHNEEGEDTAIDIAATPDTNEMIYGLDMKMLIEKIGNNGLTKREKDVFNLCIEGLTMREIGMRLGMSHVRVIKLKHKIRDKYAALFQGYR